MRLFPLMYRVSSCVVGMKPWNKSIFTVYPSHESKHPRGDLISSYAVAICSIKTLKILSKGSNYIAMQHQILEKKSSRLTSWDEHEVRLERPDHWHHNFEEHQGILRIPHNLSCKTSVVIPFQVTYLSSANKTPGRHRRGYSGCILCPLPLPPCHHNHHYHYHHHHHHDHCHPQSSLLSPVRSFSNLVCSSPRGPRVAVHRPPIMPAKNSHSLPFHFWVRKVLLYFVF